ncbi:hypothetical protein [Cryptosporangium sp. NPDC051539]|uniref:hypothetical protein n=1 Tax=Cryptosporangium sp. NPDC051539 TaxID=3363962 RepID=UPI0037A4C2F8
MTSTPSTTDRARETAGTAQQEGAALASHAKDAGSDVAQTARAGASQVASETKTQAADLFRTTKDEVKGQVDAQRQRLAGALRTTGQELGSGHEDHSRLTAEVTQRTGEYARRFADYLDQRGPDAILDDVRSFARRRPGTFLLLAGVAGVVAGRVFRGVAAASDDSDRPSAPSSRNSFADETPRSDGTYSGLGAGTSEALPVPPVATYAETAYAEDVAVGVAEVPPTPGAFGTPPNSTAPNSTAPNSTAPHSTAPYPPASDPFPGSGDIPGEPGYVPAEPGYVPSDPAYGPGGRESGYAPPDGGYPPADAGYLPAPPSAPVTDPEGRPVDPYDDPRYRDGGPR